MMMLRIQTEDGIYQLKNNSEPVWIWAKSILKVWEG